MLGSLCESESDGEPVTNVTESTPARRPSLTEALPRISMLVEGCGQSVSLKAGPHVRWAKILTRWSSRFPDSATAPMAWPLVATVGSERIAIKSIQESISRSLGPDLLRSISDKDPAVVLTVGQVDRHDPVEDVAPPFPDISAVKPEPEPEPVADVVEQEPVRIEKQRRSVKVLILSKLGAKRTKLNVSSDCLVGRLIQKWLECSRSTINADLVDLFYAGSLMDPAKALHDVLPSRLSPDERVELKAKLNIESTPKPKKNRTESVPTPPTAAPKTPPAPGRLVTQATASTSSDLRAVEQEKQLLYWAQKRNAESADLTQFIDSESDDYEDDEVALAMALSLSEVSSSSQLRPN